MSKLLGIGVGKEICAALGIDNVNVTDVEIILRAGDVGFIEVKRYLDNKEVKPIIQVLERYEITRVNKC